MIFVDTGAWFSLFAPKDANFRAARDWFAQNSEPLITTDYVVDELLTLLRYRGEAPRAIAVGEQILTDGISDVEWVTQEDFEEAWRVFCAFDDKQWSFTDCTSRVVMQRLAISTAFAFDHHLRQFGTISVVP